MGSTASATTCSAAATRTRPKNAEQLSFLIYFYMFEAADAARLRAARRPGAEPYASAFEGDWELRNPRNAHEPGAAVVPRELLRWSSWAPALNGERLVRWVREEVFPFHAELASAGATDFMAGGASRDRRADGAYPSREPA